MRRLGAGVAVLALLIAPASCGGDGAKPSLTVFAAASLKRAFTRYAARLTSVRTRLSFAGSDELAAQIRQGIRPDAFAAADTALPAALHAGRLVGAPTVFAANRLALAVPAQSTKVRTLADLSDRGVTIAIGSPSVPVGSYTRSVLGKLSGDQSRTILSHVRSNEPDVAGVVGKLSRGAVDAGFVYVTDVRASGGRLRAIELPPPLRPRVAYGIAVVQGSSHEKQARAFIAGLLSGEGRRVLRDAGFEPPPP